MAEVFLGALYAVIGIGLCAGTTYVIETIFDCETDMKSEMEEELENLARRVDQELKKKTV